MDTVIVNITDTNDIVTINVTDLNDQITVTLSDCISHIYVDGVTITGDGSYSNPLTASGGGDMMASVYDPTNIAADAFDYNNFYNTPSIPTNTSDLNNDGADGVNPFITLNDIPTVTGFVPYTGATSDVDLGEYELKAGQIKLDQSPTGTAGVAVTRWNDAGGTSETTLKGGNVVLKNGVDLVARVVNKVTPNTTLTKAAYQVVKVSGAQGQRLAIGLAQANNDNNSADTLGVVCETIPTNQEGFIQTVGQLEEINTTGSLQGETWADGDVLYLSPTTAGRVTNIKPNGSTGHIVVIGYVEYAHAIHGKIYVKIMNGWELDELHNVYINTGTLANNDALIYESSTSLWKNKTIATALGYTPENTSNKSTTTTLGTSDTLYPTQNAVKTYVDTAISGVQIDLLQVQVFS